jgi:class 3 adenylate cyclase
MTKPNDSVIRRAKIVVVSDLCSSTTILEDLLRSESHDRWRDLLIGLKEFLTEGTKALPFSIYSFVGDGWILLFDTKVSPEKLFRFLERFCQHYERLLNDIIDPVLSTRLENTGIAFGMDRGTLVQLTMNDRTEFIGRPLNVASRLQSAVKEGVFPNGKVLITNSLYADMEESVGRIYRVVPTTRNLRNLTGGKSFRCQMVSLFDKLDRRKKT